MRTTSPEGSSRTRSRECARGASTSRSSRRRRSITSGSPTAGGSPRTFAARRGELALVPAFMAAYARAARAAARDADLVHAHWIPSAIAARATEKPYVLQVWGTDVELARRVPALVRPLLRGARIVMAASTFLADEARAPRGQGGGGVPAGGALPGAG